VKLTTHLHLLGAIPPLPQYAFMAWCSVKAQGQLYLLAPITRVIILNRLAWVARVARLEDINAYKILVGRREWKRSLERNRCRWEDDNWMGICRLFIWLWIGISGGLL